MDGARVLAVRRHDRFERRHLPPGGRRSFGTASQRTGTHVLHLALGSPETDGVQAWTTSAVCQSRVTFGRDYGPSLARVLLLQWGCSFALGDHPSIRRWRWKNAPHFPGEYISPMVGTVYCGRHQWQFFILAVCCTKRRASILRASRG